MMSCESQEIPSAPCFQCFSASLPISLEGHARPNCPQCLGLPPAAEGRQARWATVGEIHGQRREVALSS